TTDWSASPPTSYTFPAAGTQTLYAWAKDAAGNVSASVSASVVITLAAPQTIFYDDFTGSSLDSSKWTAVSRQGDYTNNEDVCYSPSQVTVSGGYLTITSLYQTTSCGDSTHGSANHSVLSGFIYTPNFTFTYGTVEVKGTLGAGANGPWPTIWLLGHNCQSGLDLNAESGTSCNWDLPGSDEIDMAEFMGTATGDDQSIHTNGHDVAQTTTVSDASANTHIYQLVWQPGMITWKVDGTVTYTVSQSWVPSTPMFLIIDSAAGGQGGTPRSSAYPKRTVIDYVKITQP
ncbi:MAG TPA: glycoside hydrolase family 16 protein, partial [Acidimicrobiales bacterium]|nr:glycoside hydrolase family 16 protein [Acidimicrobiales bacterium]